MGPPGTADTLDEDAVYCRGEYVEQDGRWRISRTGYEGSGSAIKGTGFGMATPRC